MPPCRCYGWNPSRAPNIQSIMARPPITPTQSWLTFLPLSDASPGRSRCWFARIFLPLPSLKRISPAGPLGTYPVNSNRSYSPWAKP